ncbi:MAG: hypothetical protein ACJ71J_08435 [Nitrososphaeraceae archaeon]|jgi:hypothetical protein
MNDENTTTSETSSKEKHEDKKDLPTLPAETSIEDSTKLDREKKVVVVKSGEPDVKISDAQDQSEEIKREDDNIDQ